MALPVIAGGGEEGRRTGAATTGLGADHASRVLSSGATTRDAAVVVARLALPITTASSSAEVTAMRSPWVMRRAVVRRRGAGRDAEVTVISSAGADGAG